jgi:hypothetical protein
MRVIHAAQYKGGSQWVAGVLGDPAVQRIVGYQRVSGVLSANRLWKEPSDGLELWTPVYELNALEWEAVKHPGDKALVVLRDPRDCLVSMVYSVLFSHYETTRIKLQRELLYKVDGWSARIKSVLPEVHWQKAFYETWCHYAKSDTVLVRYEDLVDNQYQVFDELFDWLGWPLDKSVKEDVVSRHSFERRSGRRRGDVDEVSHYRRGAPGDWRNHFTREVGELWEALYPGLLVSIGYEKSRDWWCELPEHGETRDKAGHDSGNDLLEGQARRIRILEKEMEEKESVIRDLSDVCDKRMQVIQELQNALDSRGRGDSDDG